MTAHIRPLHGDTYAKARRVAMSAKDDWPRLLGAAQTLSQSPDHTDLGLARHIREAYSLHLAGLLKPVDPAHRDRSDLIGQWKEAALQPVEETPRDVLMKFRARLPEIILWGIGGAAVLLIAMGWGP